eukprot:1125057-Ditylum_brightwellii.AAC.1
MDKGFVYVVPLKFKGEVLVAVSLFAKEVGAQDAFICDAAGEQCSMCKVLLSSEQRNSRFPHHIKRGRSKISFPFWDAL